MVDREFTSAWQPSITEANKSPPTPDAASGQQFMAELRADHAQFSRILALLSREVGKLTHSQRLTLPLLREAFQFITTYMDTYHHPREDVLYERLARRSKRNSRMLFRLREDHKHGTLQSRRICREIEQWERGIGAESLAMLIESIDGFVDQSREHMGLEERLMYAQATKVLRERDWRAIEAAAPRSDPRFSLQHGGESRYPLLSHYFQSSGQHHVSDNTTGVVGQLRLDTAGVVYGELVGRVVGTVFLAGRQGAEAVAAIVRNTRTLCTPRAPRAYASVVCATVRNDVATITGWVNQWQEHLRIHATDPQPRRSKRRR